jgi:hypothetical protein
MLGPRETTDYLTREGEVYLDRFNYPGKDARKEEAPAD